jgi:16S rRNA (cytidine1402-2'-O)-methyltransferase
MNRQHSFENEKPTLYLVPTPIGNLNEMTPRALDVLKSVDIIACEDTRTSGQMLKHFEIESRLIAYHNFNEEASTNGILELLSEGKNIALISDAGYPLINDPGQRVVAAASGAGYNVVPVSGASAFLNAIVASGTCGAAIHFHWLSAPAAYGSFEKAERIQSVSDDNGLL